MAQSSKPTALGYAETAKRIAGAASSPMKSIVGLTGACTASEGSSLVSPGGATVLASNGFTLVDADSVTVSTTTVTDDTCELDHVFTASGSQSVSGFAVLNDDDDVVYAEVCFAAPLALESGETLTCELKEQFKLGA